MPNFNPYLKLRVDISISQSFLIGRLRAITLRVIKNSKKPLFLSGVAGHKILIESYCSSVAIHKKIILLKCVPSD